ATGDLRPGVPKPPGVLVDPPPGPEPPILGLAGAVGLRAADRPVAVRGLAAAAPAAPRGPSAFSLGPARADPRRHLDRGDERRRRQDAVRRAELCPEPPGRLGGGRPRLPHLGERRPGPRSPSGLEGPGLRRRGGEAGTATDGRLAGRPAGTARR